MYKQEKTKIHFVGIGGIGMSGIAEVLIKLGFPVSGSDASESAQVQKLKALGVHIAIGHTSSNLADAKVVVVSTAIQALNPEILEARRRNLPIISRAEMLAELMRLKYGLAVAGTHGKTTTTSLLASILHFAGLDPTAIIGGKVEQLGGNARLGQGQFLVAEADESDGSFLSLSPVVNIITNIDNDHMDFYGQMEKLRGAFVEFANKIPYYGRVIACIDNEEVRKILPLIEKPVSTYGFHHEAEFRIENYKITSSGSRFSLYQSGEYLADLDINLVGQHNAANATAATIAALEVDISLGKIIQALRDFRGVSRRLELKSILKNPRVAIYDDYGHHPSEIEATLTALRQKYPENRINVIFQPHRYSRTQLCWDQFGPSMKRASRVYLTDVYEAGESPVAGVDSSALAQHIQSQGFNHCIYSGNLDETLKSVLNDTQHDDVLLTLGAGSITHLGPKLLDELPRKF